MPIVHNKVVRLSRSRFVLTMPKWGLQSRGCSQTLDSHHAHDETAMPTFSFVKLRHLECKHSIDTGMQLTHTMAPICLPGSPQRQVKVKHVFWPVARFVMQERGWPLALLYSSLQNIKKNWASTMLAPCQFVARLRVPNRPTSIMGSFDENY